MAKSRIPPHSDEAEKGVLGALLLDKDSIVQVAEFLRPVHFYNQAHSDIFEAMMELYEEREPVDLVTVSEVLKKKKNLTRVGGRTYLSKLATGVPTAAHAGEYGKIIKDHYVKREIIKLSGDLTEIGFDEGKDVSQVLDKAEQGIFSISQRHLPQAFMAIKDALAESFDRLDELHKSADGLRGVPTGYPSLDKTLAGFHPSNLIILAARPGMGKTALALNIAQNITVKHKVPVGFFSLEMSKEELVDRLLVSQADIDAWRLKTGKLGEREFTKLSDAMGELADSPLYVDDTPGVSVLEMRTKARRLVSEHDVKLFIVDYLQLVRGRSQDNRVQEVSEISQGLKNLARELKVPVLSLSQLSRNIEHRGGAQPKLADLRDSGAIEQDADVVMFLYREDEDDMENMKLHIAKHRNGPLRTIDMRFRGDRIKFYETEKVRDKK